VYAMRLREVAQYTGENAIQLLEFINQRNTVPWVYVSETDGTLHIAEQDLVTTMDVLTDSWIVFGSNQGGGFENYTDGQFNELFVLYGSE
jgi:hypothetical protein